MGDLMLLEVINHTLFIIDNATQLVSASLELFQLELHLLILLHQQILKLLPLIPQPFDQLLVVGAHGLDINCMQTGQSLLHIVQFLLILPFPLVDLLLYELDLII